MPLNIRSEDVNRLAERLASKTNLTKTDAVRRALVNELRRLDEKLPLRERLRPIQHEIQSWPTTGLEADKAFFDDLSGDP